MSFGNAGEAAGNGSDRAADAARQPEGTGSGDAVSPALRAPASAAPQPTQEKELWAGRGDWKYQFGVVSIWILTAAAALIMAYVLVGPDQGWVRLVAWIVVLLVGLRALWVVVSHVHGTRYRLTTQRLFVDRGILSRTTDQIELIRVDDVRVHQRLPDRIFKIGSVEVLSTDLSDAKLRMVGIREPDRVAEHIREHMRTLRKKSLFIESL